MNALDIKAIDISAHNEKQFAAKSASHDNDDNNGNAKATATSNRQKSRQKNIYKIKKKTYVETKRSTSYESFDS